MNFPHKMPNYKQHTHSRSVKRNNSYKLPVLKQDNYPFYKYK